ncbi:hypothetical protein ACFFRR_007522 [Megaselia abdita]
MRGYFVFLCVILSRGIADSGFVDNLNASLDIYLKELKENTEDRDQCFEEHRKKWDEALFIYKQGEVQCNAENLEALTKAADEAFANKLLLDEEWESTKTMLNVCYESENYAGVFCYETEGTKSGNKANLISRDAGSFLIVYNYDVELARNNYITCESEFREVLEDTELEIRKELDNCVLGVTPESTTPTEEPTTPTEEPTTPTEEPTTPVEEDPTDREPVPEIDDSSELEYYN